MITKDTLVYDLECATPDKRANPTKDIVKVMGAYSYITNKYYVVFSKKEMELLISKHKNIVGFNTLGYDNVVLYHNGFHKYVNYNEQYSEAKLKGKNDIDCLDIIRKRAAAMKTKKGMLGDLLMRHSLDFITRTLDLVDDETAKDNIDYELFNKKSWTNEELEKIKFYTKRDIEITKKLYEWLENYFDSFKYYLPQKDIDKKNYLTSSISSFAYKAICHRLGWKEEYGDMPSEKYEGGYVAYPAGEEFHDDYMYCLDYNSLYPHVFAQCNLYSHATNDEEYWNGNGVFEVEGKYKKDGLGKIERLLMDFYQERLQLKKNKDPKEYSIKIIINTMYGLSGNPSFKHLFNPTTAADCTRLARQWTKLARKLFKEAGYKIIYTDTDSVYLIDTFRDKDKMLKVRDSIIKQIKDNVPFPQDTFDMGIDDEITDMFFFKGKNTDDKESDKQMDEDDFINKPKGYMKKNYIYITKENKVIYKNLGVKKKSTSLLTRKIFKEYLIPKILEERAVKFSKTYFNNLITKLLEDDIFLATTRKTANAFESYKSKTSIQAQIAKKYGKGIRYLIKNKKIGIGIGSKYCSIEEFKNANMTINDIDLTTVWSELNYFIKEKKVVNLNEWGII